MPSITSYTSDIPSRVGYFKGNSSSGDYYPLSSSLTFSVGSPAGVTAVNGTSIYFSSYTDVTTWLTGAGGISVVNSDYFRDMGKTYTIYVQQEKNTGGYIYLPVLRLTKAQKYISPGESTEGPTGNPVGASDLQGFDTVFLVTWSANPASVPVSVTRVGYD
jgi:hypothetical protein